MRNFCVCKLFFHSEGRDSLSSLPHRTLSSSEFALRLLFSLLFFPLSLLLCAKRWLCLCVQSEEGRKEGRRLVSFIIQTRTHETLLRPLAMYITAHAHTHPYNLLSQKLNSKFYLFSVCNSGSQPVMRVPPVVSQAVQVSKLSVRLE